MTPGNISLFNAIVLITLGLMGYFSSDDPSKTAFIPVGFGVLLVALNPGVRAHNKTVAHIAVAATLLILLGLIMPLRGAIGRGDTAAIVRVVIMLATTAWAIVAFIQSFIQARREKMQAAGATGSPDSPPPAAGSESENDSA